MAYREKVKALSDIERQSTEREKTGVFTGRYAINPLNGEKLPGLGRRLRPGRLRHGRNHGRACPRPA